MIKIENHLEVYVDDLGRVCLAQPSMDEDCSIALEPEEAKTLISWLEQALDEATAASDSPVDSFEENRSNAPSLT